MKKCLQYGIQQKVLKFYIQLKLNSTFGLQEMNFTSTPFMLTYAYHIYLMLFYSNNRACDKMLNGLFVI